MSAETSLMEPIGKIARIQCLVASSYGISRDAMRSSSRLPRDVWPRQVAMYLARQITKKSFPCIGREFGHRDHSTVIHALKAVEQRVAADLVDRADVEALREALSG